MIEFTITEEANPNHYEEIGLHFTFFEKKMRGSEKIQYIVMAEEHGVGDVEVNDTIVCNSWEELKEKYPTLKSLLVDFSTSYNWTASWRQNERVLYIESIEGNEGLYDVNQIVFYDYEDEENVIEFVEKDEFQEKSSKTKEKKKSVKNKK